MNTNECSRSKPALKDSQVAPKKKVNKTLYKVQQQDQESLGEKSCPTVHATSSPLQKSWNTPSGLKFLCPMSDHKHEVGKCAEFFALSSLE